MQLEGFQLDSEKNSQGGGRGGGGVEKLQIICPPKEKLLCLSPELPEQVYRTSQQGIILSLFGDGVVLRTVTSECPCLLQGTF